MDAFTFDEVGPPHIDLSIFGIEEAVRFIDKKYGRRRWQYTLVVPPEQETDAKLILRCFGKMVDNNPLAPFVNLRVELGHTVPPRWWFVQAVEEAHPERRHEATLVVSAGSVGVL